MIRASGAGLETVDEPEQRRLDFQGIGESTQLIAGTLDVTQYSLMPTVSRKAS